jgi:VanZ family protein
MAAPLRNATPLRASETTVPQQDSALRRFLYWLFLLALAIATVLLFVGGKGPFSHRLTGELWNSGHVLLFCGFAILLGARLHTPGIVVKLVVVMAVAAPLGLLVEIIQRYTGRDFSLLDVVFDTLGAYVGLLIGARRQVLAAARPVAWGVCTVGVIGLLLIGIPIGGMAWDTLQAYRQFPLLAGFTSPLERGRFNEGDALRIMDEGLEVQFQKAAYSGFFLDDFPRDWRGYNTLVLDIFNPGRRPLPLHCRIHDRAHNQDFNDRYNGQFLVLPGQSTIRIDLKQAEIAPHNRKLALDDVAGVGCFLVNSPGGQIMYVSQIRLQ